MVIGLPIEIDVRQSLIGRIIGSEFLSGIILQIPRTGPPVIARGRALVFCGEIWGAAVTVFPIAVSDRPWSPIPGERSALATFPHHRPCSSSLSSFPLPFSSPGLLLPHCFGLPRYLLVYGSLLVFDCFFAFNSLLVLRYLLVVDCFLSSIPSLCSLFSCF
jgi:hypothetical protein